MTMIIDTVVTRNDTIMSKVVFTLIFTVITFAITKSANTRMSDTSKDGLTTVSMTQDSTVDNSNDLDVEAIMNTCNETFRIEMAYIDALNASGSFIDETDKTPKCFIRCVLEAVGVLSEDTHQFNPARAAIIFAGERNGKPMNDIGDMTALCSADRTETCLCERSYQFLKCLMRMEIEMYEKS